MEALKRRTPNWLLELVGYRVPATTLSLSITFIAAIYGLWQGMNIVVSNPVRFQNPVYKIMDGYASLWGLAVFTFGAFILGGLVHHNFTLKAIGLLGLSAWHAIFAVYSFRAMLGIPAAASTPTPVYTFVAVTLAVLVWMDEKRLARYDKDQDVHLDSR